MKKHSQKRPHDLAEGLLERGYKKNGAVSYSENRPLELPRATCYAGPAPRCYPRCTWTSSLPSKYRFTHSASGGSCPEAGAE
jgi:hypothetical protein